MRQLIHLLLSSIVISMISSGVATAAPTDDTQFRQWIAPEECVTVNEFNQQHIMTPEECDAYLNPPTPQPEPQPQPTPQPTELPRMRQPSVVEYFLSYLLPGQSPRLSGHDDSFQWYDKVDREAFREPLDVYLLILMLLALFLVLLIRHFWVWLPRDLKKDE